MAEPGGGGGPLTYREAGVDIDAGDRLVRRIARETARTRRPGADGALGGFGGLFDLSALSMNDPVLVAATDGVGTKLELAIAAGRLRGVGIDLVAMCVNDLVVQGAEPLFFLDYYACGRLDEAAAAEVVAGIADGCVAAGCALVGGETAEMPGFYPPGRFDLAGFSVGAVERTALLPRKDVAAGDVLLGLTSSGVHSNGFSLVRRVMERAGLSAEDTAPFAPGVPLGEALLTPTRIYVKPLLAILARSDGMKALAHVTGGGLTENLPRVLPAGVSAAVDLSAVPRLAVFDWLKTAGGIEAGEMLRTFNCGVGMVAVVAEGEADAVLSALRAEGETAFVLGRLEPAEGAPTVAFSGTLFGG